MSPPPAEFLFQKRRFPFPAFLSHLYVLPRLKYLLPPTFLPTYLPPLSNLSSSSNLTSPPFKRPYFLSFQDPTSPTLTQCSGSGIRCFLTPGSGIRIWNLGWKKIWIRNRDEHTRLFFLELRNNVFGLKILKFFDAIRDGKIRIRYPV